MSHRFILYLICLTQRGTLQSGLGPYDMMVVVFGSFLLSGRQVVSGLHYALPQTSHFSKEPWLFQPPAVFWIYLQTGAHEGACGTLAQFQWCSQIPADESTQSGVLFFGD